MFADVLVPLDGSTASEQALAFAKEMATGKIRLLHLVNFPSGATAFPARELPAGAGVWENELAASRSYLEGIGQKLIEQGYQASWSDRIGEPARGILQELEEHPMDLVVMASHGRTGLKRFLLGSVAEKVARHAPCPVLLVRREGGSAQTA